MVQVVPQFEIIQQFSAAPAAAVDQLRALLVGPDYVVRDYANGKSVVALGAYDSSADLVVNWPGRLAGEVVDQGSAKVRLDRAALRHTTILAASAVQTVVGTPNQIRNGSLVWATGNGVTRSVAVATDVKVGDHVRLTAGANVLISSVMKIVADTVAATIDSTPDADPANVPTGGLYTVPVVAAAGTYTGALDSTYVVRCTTAGATDGTAKITFSTTNNVDAGGPYSVNTGVAIPLGSLGVTITFTGAELKLDDVWTIAVTSAKDGALKTLELANQLPAAMQAVNLQVELSIPADIEVSTNRVGYAPLKNVTTSATQVTLESGILATHTRTGALELTAILGDAYASYRALRTVGANTVRDIAVVGDIALYTGGLDSPDAVLACGLHRALENANGTIVKMIAVESDDLAGYNKALARLKEREDFHRIVPLTSDEAIIDACIAVATQRSGATVGRWAATAFALEVKEQVKLHEGLATIQDDAGTAGTQYTIVHDDDGLFITKGTRAGDIIRGVYTTDGFGGDSYQSLVIDAVLSEEEVRIIAGPALPVNLASKYELWRPLTTSERVDDWGTRTRARTSRRNVSVFCPKPKNGGVEKPAWLVPAGYAALRGSVAPQQGLTNAELLGWDDLSEVTETYGDLLDEVANHGGMIVTQDPDGRVYIRKQLTTDISDTKKAEDSATVNLDAISYFFKSRLAPKVGRTNVVGSNLEVIRADINAAILELKNSQFSTELGGMIVDGELISLRAHATLLDRIVVELKLTLPIPLNNGSLTIVV